MSFRQCCGNPHLSEPTFTKHLQNILMIERLFCTDMKAGFLSDSGSPPVCLRDTTFENNCLYNFTLFILVLQFFFKKKSKLLNLAVLFIRLVPDEYHKAWSRKQTVCVLPSSGTHLHLVVALILKQFGILNSSFDLTDLLLLTELQFSLQRK